MDRNELHSILCELSRDEAIRAYVTVATPSSADVTPQFAFRKAHVST
jgi:hypothetical protein